MLKNLTYALCLLLAFPAAAADWPQWLGPNRDGHAEDKIVAPAGDGEFKQLWKYTVGIGWATPVISGERLIIHHRVGADERIDCLDPKTGELLWKRSFVSNYRDRFGMEEGPRSTPTITDGKVFTHGPQGLLSCHDLATGKPVWTVDLAKRFGSPQGFFGRCSSPLVLGKRVIVDVGGRIDGKDAGVAAFDLASGKLAWSSTKETNDYSSPQGMQVGKRSCALFFTRGGFTGVDAQTGRPLFFEVFRSPIEASVNAATPMVIGDQVFLTSCYDVGAAAWRLAEGNGGVSAKLLWKKGGALDAHYATPVHRNGFLYGFHGRQERGPELRCINLSDGSVKWTSGRMAAGSLLCSGDKLVVVTEDGELLLVEASPKAYKVLHRQQVVGFGARAAPSIANGRLYLRDKRRLACFSLK